MAGSGTCSAIEIAVKCFANSWIDGLKVGFDKGCDEAINGVYIWYNLSCSASDFAGPFRMLFLMDG